jgi:hypothetical protein
MLHCGEWSEGHKRRRPSPPLPRTSKIGVFWGLIREISRANLIEGQVMKLLRRQFPIWQRVLPLFQSSRAVRSRY